MLKTRNDIYIDLNIRLLEAFHNLTLVNYEVSGFHLETNFITGEIIFTNGYTEFIMLPYLTSDELKIQIYRGSRIEVTEIIILKVQTKKLLLLEWSTNDMIVFITNIFKKKLIEFKKLC